MLTKSAENPPQMYNTLLDMELSIKTSSKSTRKYPNVMWFPRSKTDPQEIREVLKLALKVQKDNPDKYFNDKLLGKYMAQIGSINIVGMLGKDYIDAYEGKSIGDISYITNARMLMRVFRFLGLVTRISKGKYVVTKLGEVYASFNGDFPSKINGENEEQMLLQSLSDFAFYCVNDDSAYRDSSFQIRPFIWLLNTLAIEPQCIYQLTITSFASKSESSKELERITSILKGLRNDTTTLKDEFANAGLDADDYSCVHNFYDSVKILVYLGTSLGLIDKTSNPGYGKKISGNAKHLKQASVFYTLTDKGKKYLDEKIKNKLIYYEDIYKAIPEDSILGCSLILASLNYVVGKKQVLSINSAFYKKLLGEGWEKYLELIKSHLEIEIQTDGQWITLNDNISFNFYQSIPPELLHIAPFKQWYNEFINEAEKEKSEFMKLDNTTIEEQFTGDVTSEFILDRQNEIKYQIPQLNIEQAEAYLKYSDKENIFGGQDRFAGRVSPTNSVLLVGDRIHVDNDKDALDLLIPLRTPDTSLRKFIDSNLQQLLVNFLTKSDTWAKDQHYTWVRNCFRQFGAEAIYSGSGGMLSRADISVISPFVGGVEAKSPTENRGSLNIGAIRQAVDAKVQVGHKYPEKKNLPRVSIAIGRRITPLAIEEEKKWRKEGQPVLLISDIALYYLTLKTLDINFSNESILRLFTQNQGVLSKEIIQESLEDIFKLNNVNEEIKEKINKELSILDKVMAGAFEGAIES